MSINPQKTNNRNMNISTLSCVFFGQKHINSREGGIEIVVEELATRMAKRGFNVTCINRKGHHVSGKEFDTESLEEYRGVKILTVPTIVGKGLSALSSSFFASIKAACGDYNVVHIHAEGPALFCWIPKLAGKRVICTVHGLDHQRAKWSWVGRWCILQGEKAAVKYSDEIIVLSKAVQRYFVNKYNRKTTFIPNGVNRPKLVDAYEITKRWDLKKDSYILFLGRIVPEKGIHYLINAYKKVKTEKKLVIAGGSSDSDKYMKELFELGGDNIIFTGFQQGRILEELYSNAYIYCLPSDLEGMPLSLLEAMSFGNCCLVSNIPECIEVIEDKAIVFEKGNVEHLSQKLVELLDDEETVRRFQASATDFICQKYNWDQVVDKTLELYEKHGTSFE